MVVAFFWNFWTEPQKARIEEEPSAETAGLMKGT